MNISKIFFARSGEPKKEFNPATKFFVWTALILVTALVIFGPAIFPGNSKLYEAIENGDEAQVHRLLSEGADPNSRSRGLVKGRTVRYQLYPLMYALWNNRPDIGITLLEFGANPNVRGWRGQTALIEAASSGHTDLVRALIEKGADVRAASSTDGETPLRYGTSGPTGLKTLKPEIEAMLKRAGAN